MRLLLYAYNVQIRDTCLLNDLKFASCEDVMLSIVLPQAKFVPSFPFTRTLEIACRTHLSQINIYCVIRTENLRGSATSPAVKGCIYVGSTEGNCRDVK
ncbi:hypothetical protein IMY05_005G0086200 [Salix suchowensis]|nr:hypothetical protein IMY05_005G0086200 [Salix suchowensis]